MEYAQFITAIKSLRDEGTQLFGREKLHEDRQFRKWRHQLTDVIDRIRQQGYVVNCQVSTRSFDQPASPDTPRTQKARVAAYDQELLDTINELDTLIKRYEELGTPRIADIHAAPDKNDADIFAKLRRHWLASAVGLCSLVAGTTWLIGHQLFVAPRDFEIDRLKAEVTSLKEQLTQAREGPRSAIADPVPPPENQLLLSYVGVAAGNSITTPDGALTVRIVRTFSSHATLEASIGAEESHVFEGAEIGRRVIVPGATQTYYIDLHRERGNMIDLSVSSAPPRKPAPAGAGS